MAAWSCSTIPSTELNHPRDTANRFGAMLRYRDAIQNDRTPIVSGEDGLHALEVAEKILRAIEAEEST